MKIALPVIIILCLIHLYTPVLDGNIVLPIGDFRYCPLMLKHPPLKNKKIDVLYLDNTNCDPEYNVPSRQEATKQIVDLIETHPDHDIVIGLYSIGKECLLVDLAKTFSSWIVVSPQRMELLNLLEIEDVFTTQEGGGRIRAVDQCEVIYTNMVKWNSIFDTIAILPTSRKVKVKHKDIHVVPYSDHSSFDELIEFVSQVRPSSIVPVVKTQQCLLHFKQYLSSETAQNIVNIPTSVKMFMRKQNLSLNFRAKRFKVPLNKTAPRGVEFESPVKPIQCKVEYDCPKNDKGMSSAGQDHVWQRQNTTVSCSNSENLRPPTPLTESTVLGPSKNGSPSKSSWSSKSCETSANEIEMPSAIWPLQNINASILSDTSVVYKETNSFLNTSPLVAPSVSLSFTKVNGFSLLPCTKRKLLDTTHFNNQVEQYIRNCIEGHG